MRTEPTEQRELSPEPRGFTRPSTARPSRLLLPHLALLSLSILLLFWKLGTTSFHNGDEGQYAQCAKEMIETGDYLTVQCGGQPFLQKPPAKIWFIALGFKLLGVNEWGARLSSALFALGTVTLTVLLGRALIGPWAGLLAGTILVSAPQFLHEHCARTSEYEPETVFFFTLAMVSLHRMGRNRRWVFALAAAVGFLSMVKGPVALPALGIAVLYVLLRRPRPSLGPLFIALGILTFLLIALPWPVHQFVTHGDAFKRMYLDAQILGRLTGQPPPDLIEVVPGLHPGNPLLFYPRVLFFGMFPWSVAITPALGLLLVSVVRRSIGRQLLPLLWIAIFSATIAVANAKFSWYAVPILPPLAVSVAWFVRRVAQTASPLLFYGIWIVLLIASLIFAPSPEYDPYRRVATLWPGAERNLVAMTELMRWDGASWLPLAATVALAAGVVIAYVATRRRRRRWNGRGSFVGFVIGSLLLSGICQAALPLRNVDYRNSFARCRDAVDELGVAPVRVLIIDDATFQQAVRFTSFFYVYEMSGGSSGRIVNTRPDPAARLPSGIRTPGTILIGNPQWDPRFAEADGLVELWRDDDILAVYVP